METKTELSDPSRVRIGQRIMYKNKVGTVRWRGMVMASHCNVTAAKRAYGGVVHSDDTETPAAPTDVNDDDEQDDVEVLGIEWDGWTTGTHNGTVEGIEYFKPYRVTLFTEAMAAVQKTYDKEDEEIRNYRMRDTMYAILRNHGNFTCSFLKEDQVECGVTMAEAIYDKYLVDTSDETAEFEAHKSVNGKLHIGHAFVGRSKAVSFFSQTSNLLLLGLQDSRIDRVGDLAQFTFPKVREVYLMNNLISEWPVVVSAMEHFPSAHTLDVSGNVFTVTDNIPFEAPKLRTVSLNKTVLRFSDAVEMLKDLPNLSVLSLCGNAYADLGCLSKLEHLISLDVSDNSIWNWYSMFRCLISAPTLRKFIISNNSLCNICVDPETGNRISLYQGALSVAQLNQKTLEAFHELEELHLDGNYIYDWGTLSELTVIFPNLKALRFKLCLMNVEASDATLGLHRQVLIAIFPRLEILNGSYISKGERLNAERYYLRLATVEKQIFAKVNHPKGLAEPHSRRLEQIHGRRETGEEKGSSAYHLDARMIQVTMIPDGNYDNDRIEPISRRLPPSTSVRDLKSLCSKLFNLELSDIVLAYNNGKMPICERMDDDDVEIQTYGISDGYNIRIQSRRTVL
ncbi:hypothetical protein BgAZ_206210 [Babesia gibsoni]|uniref:CAP-Gly domain-containing protein n=1 Tax=Babesia gibsoni TaxID=33632 RepID=A0AAD8P9M3_BABGI|nr:hypothetical protein BgAZ_206210 [Babesia gibsoni]